MSNQPPRPPARPGPERPQPRPEAAAPSPAQPAAQRQATPPPGVPPRQPVPPQGVPPRQTGPQGRMPAAQQRQPVDLATRLDGQRGWLAQLDRSLKKRSIIALVLTCLAVGVGAAALYVSLTKNADSDRIDALQTRITNLETAAGIPSGGTDATVPGTDSVLPSTGITTPDPGVTYPDGTTIPPTGTTDGVTPIIPAE